MGKVEINLGVGVPIFVLFFVAKVAGYLDWGWLWVLSPLWLPFVGAIVIFWIAAIVYAFIGLIKTVRTMFGRRK